MASDLETDPQETKSSKRPSDSAARPAASDEPTPAPSAARTQPRLDDSKLVACYANFCRVTGSPEELILDFGLNPQPFGAPVESLDISQRIIVNFYTAKRMAAALQMALQRHEAAFGVLETDVQKRVLPSAFRGASREEGG